MKESFCIYCQEDHGSWNGLQTHLRDHHRGTYAQHNLAPVMDVTPAQRRVILTPGVTMLGKDANGRPVVEMLTGIPQQLRRWALTRRGDPADVKEPIDEVWACRVP